MTPYLGNPGYLITSPSGLTMTVSVDDMFVMKQLNPLDPFMRGLGVAEDIPKGVAHLQKAASHTEAKEELLNYKKTLFGKWVRRK